MRASPTRQFAECKQTLELDPHFALAYKWLSVAYEEKHLDDAAFEVEQKARIAYEAADFAEETAHAYRSGGRRAKLLLVLREALKEYKATNLDAIGVAVVYAQLGQNDQAFAYLERAYGAREPSMPLINARSEAGYVAFRCTFPETSAAHEPAALTNEVHATHVPGPSPRQTLPLPRRGVAEFFPEE